MSRFFLLFIFCVFSFVYFQNSGHANDKAVLFERTIEYGIPVGTVIPHDLGYTDQKGTKQHFSRLVGRNGLVMFFIRSADWCPYCKKQLEEIAKKGSYLENMGWNIVVVSYDRPDRIKRFIHRFDFTYPFLSDPTSEIIKSFDLLNKSYVHGTSYYGVSHPGVYIIGKDGFIIDKIQNEDIKIRPNIQDLQKRLRKIGNYTPVLKEPAFKALEPKP